MESGPENSGWRSFNRFCPTIVGGADVGLVLAHGDPAPGIEVDFVFALHAPARLCELRVNLVAGELFRVLVLGSQGHDYDVDPSLRVVGVCKYYAPGQRQSASAAPAGKRPFRLSLHDPLRLSGKGYAPEKGVKPALNRSKGRNLAVIFDSPDVSKSL